MIVYCRAEETCKSGPKAKDVREFLSQVPDDANFSLFRVGSDQEDRSGMRATWTEIRDAR